MEDYHHGLIHLPDPPAYIEYNYCIVMYRARIYKEEFYSREFHSGHFNTVSRGRGEGPHMRSKRCTLQSRTLQLYRFEPSIWSSVITLPEANSLDLIQQNFRFCLNLSLSHRNMKVFSHLDGWERQFGEKNPSWSFGQNKKVFCFKLTSFRCILSLKITMFKIGIKSGILLFPSWPISRQI